MEDESARDQKVALGLPPGLCLYPDQEAAIGSLLSELNGQLPARFVMLVDVSGQPVSFEGERVCQDLVGLASLVAGDIAASQEASRMTNQYEASQLVLRAGQHTNAFAVEAGPHLVLYAHVSADVPLGWARMLVCNAGQRIGKIAAKPTTLPPTRGIEGRLMGEGDIDSAFDGMLRG